MCCKSGSVDTAGSYQLFLVIIEKPDSFCDHIKICQHCIVLHLLPSVKKNCGGRGKCGILTKYKGSNC